MCAQYGTLLVRYWILLLTYGQGSNTSMMRILRMRMFAGALYAYTHTLRVGIRICAPDKDHLLAYNMRLPDLRSGPHMVRQLNGTVVAGGPH